ncbi:MAG TPA: type II toxin-antitoxin system VapC family toxin [Thermoanaerobaculia bacterium]|nr:type II toxin-antitoxin system VapC family toxin [Thermoanaerobaculia bacterium]
MRPKVYVETSILSYLTSWLSRDLVLAAHQQITQQWWVERRSGFELFASQAVVNEASAGDEKMAQRRLDVLDELPLLDITAEVSSLAEELIRIGPIPPKAAVDAVHVAVSSVYRVDYLLTWNCRHLANAAMRPRMEQVCRSLGYSPVVICTPEELMEV